MGFVALGLGVVARREGVVASGLRVGWAHNIMDGKITFRLVVGRQERCLGVRVAGGCDGLGSAVAWGRHAGGDRPLLEIAEAVGVGGGEVGDE